MTVLLDVSMTSIEADVHTGFQQANLSLWQSIESPNARLRK